MIFFFTFWKKNFVIQNDNGNVLQKTRKWNFYIVPNICFSFHFLIDIYSKIYIISWLKYLNWFTKVFILNSISKKGFMLTKKCWHFSLLTYRDICKMTNRQIPRSLLGSLTCASIGILVAIICSNICITYWVFVYLLRLLSILTLLTYR